MLEWLNDAECAPKRLGARFDDLEESAQRQLCKECPVIAECLEWGIDNGLTHIVYAGKRARKQPRARKPR